jgi:serine/threonine protein kinase
MVEMRPTDRYPSLTEAITAVRFGRDPEARTLLPTIAARKAPPDAENLEPGTRIGTDYEIRMRLGQGGMSVVYAARHLVSGRTARPQNRPLRGPPAEDALRGEYDALSSLDHPNIARVIDLTKMVEGRLTMVMERVGDETLRQWLTANPTPEPNTQRRLAEDLLAGLDYLEQRGVTHKDLKPENLLICDGRLTIIDFSLAGIPADASHGGTALYRDPSSALWTHATDRFAAALCLFELYAGRHAFEGKVPEPGQSPAVREDDIDPPGLAAFFFKALDPVPEKRFPSARALRDALIVALGDDVSVPTASAPLVDIDASTPLRLTGLPRRALNILARNQCHTAGELLTFSPPRSARSTRSAPGPRPTSSPSRTPCARVASPRSPPSSASTRRSSRTSATRRSRSQSSRCRAPCAPRSSWPGSPPSARSPR